MDKNFIAKQKELLAVEKERLEKQLSSFAEKSSQSDDNWNAKMPSYDGGGIEEEADEVEEFSTRLALEKTLEKQLKNVNLALEKIKKGKYGLCERCQKPIVKGRLQVHPRARYCKKCQ